MSSQSTFTTARGTFLTIVPSRRIANKMEGLPESLWTQKIPGCRRLLTIPDASGMALGSNLPRLSSGEGGPASKRVVVTSGGKKLMGRGLSCEHRPAIVSQQSGTWPPHRTLGLELRVDRRLNNLPPSGANIRMDRNCRRADQRMRVSYGPNC